MRFTAAFVSFPRAVARARPAVRPKAAFMQDIVHDAHSFATQITAKGACRYTNTTRNPPHRASRNGKAEPRAMDSSRNREDVSPRSKSFGLLGRRRGHFLQQIASYERLDAGEKARRSFHICKTPGHEHSLRGFQKVSHPLGGADSYLDSGLRRQPQPPPAVVYRIVDGPAALPEGL